MERDEEASKYSFEKTGEEKSKVARDDSSIAPNASSYLSSGGMDLSSGKKRKRISFMRNLDTLLPPITGLDNSSFMRPSEASSTSLRATNSMHLLDEDNFGAKADDNNEPNLTEKLSSIYGNAEDDKKEQEQLEKAKLFCREQIKKIVIKPKDIQETLEEFPYYLE